MDTVELRKSHREETDTNLAHSDLSGGIQTSWSYLPVTDPSLSPITFQIIFFQEGHPNLMLFLGFEPLSETSRIKCNTYLTDIHSLFGEIRSFWCLFRAHGRSSRWPPEVIWSRDLQQILDLLILCNLKKIVKPVNWKNCLLGNVFCGIALLWMQFSV